MTTSLFSDVNTQYLVKIFKSVCFAKNVLSKINKI
ncbi:hypothetical protein SFB5_333G2, partial [Candidatus Arthromitus sp. SFB-5]